MYFKILEFLKKPSSPNFVELLMPKYISEPNKHIEEYLDYYCNDRLNDYAVLIKGDWGAGKTWFIKEYEKKLNQDGFNRVVYISLNGVSGKDAIDDMIFCALHPVLSHKITKVLGRVAAEVIKASTKFDMAGGETTLSLSTPTIDVGSVFKDGNKLILIFDDLERCQMKVSEILGYINYFVEHTESSAIILANEEKLKTCEIYKNEKEKLVGATFKFEGDICSALNYFIDDLPRSEAKFKLQPDNIKKIIIDIYQKSGFNNIRVLRRSILWFSKFYDSDLFKDDNNAFIIFLKTYLIYSLECSNNNYKLGSNCEDFDSGDYLSQKYENSLFEKYMMSEDIWRDLIINNIINYEVLKKELEENYFIYTEYSPAWRRLWGCFGLKNEEFNILLTEVLLQLKNSEFKNYGEVIHVVRILNNFKTNKVRSLNLEKIKELALENIIEIFKNKQSSHKDRLNEILGGSGWGGLGYQGRYDEFIADFIDNVHESIESYCHQNMKNEAIILLELMKKDINQFCKQISFTRGDHGDSQLPILSHIDHMDFSSVLLTLNIDDLNSFFDALLSRLKNVSQGDSMYSEIEWCSSIKKHLQKLADDKGSIEKLNIEKFFIQRIDDLLKS